MGFFKISPVTVLFFTFFVSSCIFSGCNAVAKSVICIISGVLLCISVCLKRAASTEKTRRNRRYAIFLFIALITAGIYSYVTFDIKYGSIKEKYENGCEGYVKLVITDCDYSLPYTAQYRARIIESDTLPKNMGILLTSEHIGMEYGQVLEGKAAFHTLEGVSSGSFDAERYYLPKNIFLTAEDKALVMTDEKRSAGLKDIFRIFNGKLTSAIVAHTERDSGGVAAAVLLGNKKHLSDTVSRDFRRLGISHLLVVSGMHFSVILTLLESRLRKMRMRPSKRAWIKIPVILLFMLITGMSGSVLRCGIMYLAAQLCILIDGRTEYIHSLALAGSAVVLVNPTSACDCGLQLSFAAAYGCLVFMGLKELWNDKRSEKRKKNINKPVQKRVLSRLVRSFIKSSAEAVLLTAVVNTLMLPLIWLYFREISLVSLLANIIFIPLVTWLMYLTGAYLILYPVRIFIIPLSLCIDKYCTLMLYLAGRISQLDDIMLSVDYPFTEYFLIPITVAAILLLFVPKKKVAPVLIAILSCTALFILTVIGADIIERQKVIVSYINAKLNDGLEIKSDGKLIICDMSDGSFGYIGAMADNMTSLHSCEIDAVLLTHYHSRHVQTLEHLGNRETVREIVLPAPINESEENIFLSIVDFAVKRGITVTEIASGEAYSAGDCDIFIHDRSYISRSSHPISAVSVYANDNIVTLLSSSFNQAEPELTEYAESSDIVIFGGHSPKYKKTVTLDMKTEPTALIVSDSAYEAMSEELRHELSQYRVYLENDLTDEEYASVDRIDITINQNGKCTIRE